MPWYAHSLPGRPGSEWETQRDHAARVAEAAARRAGKFGLAPVAEAAGWLHDLGKYTSAFQGHIAGRGRAAEDRDHASAGAVHARNRLGEPVGAIVAHVVAGHHAGLKDALLGEGQRLDRREAALGPVVRTAGVDGFPFPGLPPPEVTGKLGTRSGFALALLTRMLFSCLVDGDRAETRAAENERLARAGLPPVEEEDPPFTATAERDEVLRAFDAMKRKRLKEPLIVEKENVLLVNIRHESLASPAEAFMKYLEAHEEITSAIARDLTGIRSENSMKDVF